MILSTYDFAACFAKYPILPDKPTGWKRDLVMHINMGRKKGKPQGAAIYTISDPDGMTMPFEYGYNTESDWEGFIAEDPDGTRYVYTWPELVAAWPRFITDHVWDTPSKSPL